MLYAGACQHGLSSQPSLIACLQGILEAADRDAIQRGMKMKVNALYAPKLLLVRLQVCVINCALQMFIQVCHNTVYTASAAYLRNRLLVTLAPAHSSDITTACCLCSWWGNESANQSGSSSFRETIKLKDVHMLGSWQSVSKTRLAACNQQVKKGCQNC